MEFLKQETDMIKSMTQREVSNNSSVGVRLKWREVGVRNIREKNAASLAPWWDGRSPMQFQLFLVVFSKWLVVLLFHPQAQLWYPPCYTRSKTLLSLMVNKHLHELMDRKLSKLKWCIRFLLCPQAPRHHGTDFSWLFRLFIIHSLAEVPLCVGITLHARNRRIHKTLFLFYRMFKVHQKS